MLAKQVLICGVFHKIGINGFVFMEIDGEWVRSAKSATDVRALLGVKVNNSNRRSKSWCR